MLALEQNWSLCGVLNGFEEPLKNGGIKNGDIFS